MMNLLSLDLGLFLPLHKALPQPEKFKEELEKSIEDVMKGRGEAQILPKGTIPDGAKKIDGFMKLVAVGLMDPAHHAYDPAPAEMRQNNLFD